MPITRRRLALLACIVLLPSWAIAQSLTVSAAASLTEAFKEIGARFDAARGGSTRFNFAASGVLITQIAQGAPVDVFVSADQESVDRGVKAGLLDPATRRDFASNSLVLIVPAQDALAITALGELNRADVRRIAVGKPATVPVGRYTRQALETVGLWTSVEPRIVYANSVRQVLDYVARGEADAGFVYRTDAELARDKVRQVVVVAGHAPVTYPAAVVQDSRQQAAARAFVDFLAGPEAQAILARHGFDK
ncbi:molybdate ABC transporter substrate-binding protein [Roseateles saccharophilus]|uniref:Molybdate transport system substrate-binding protein n=1 Tax=Roseateles saccharophilus TaxID=304 RepID=A0A4R3VI82_ROSSA|nr:molybdate ABC transporter substrate-binding protein [Roseateles saccharophilus]MDG0832041.1 molybdate ABC transporter substrate-binding protein [Roseateles saccharophilus]TCV03449.1 molybdate transport system substrate-binding protein [Roseateles saccharophilus]